MLRKEVGEIKVKRVVPLHELFMKNTSRPHFAGRCNWSMSLDCGRVIWHCTTRTNQFYFLTTTSLLPGLRLAACSYINFDWQQRFLQNSHVTESQQQNFVDSRTSLQIDVGSSTFVSVFLLLLFLMQKWDYRGWSWNKYFHPSSSNLTWSSLSRSNFSCRPFSFLFCS